MDASEPAGDPAVAEPLTITEPGIYTMSAAAYHADPCPEPSLSNSLARTICYDSTAHAFWQHPRLNTQFAEEESERFDIGSAVHALLLEGNAAVCVVNADSYRTAAAKAMRDGARAAGLIPILINRWADVQAMALIAREQLACFHDGSERMFTEGVPEQTLIWQDTVPLRPDLGMIWCRARLDWLRPIPTGWAIDDYKSTSTSANPETWTRSLFFSGGDMQAAWYRRGLAALYPDARRIEFRFAVQETYPPYALSVIALSPEADFLAEKKCVFAIERFAEARQQNEWTGYPRRTCYANLPAVHEMWWLERETR
jgi:hypothetical protein